MSTTQSGWQKTKPFVRENSDLIRSEHQAYHLSSNREHNGLAAAGACKKVPGIGVIWNAQRFLAWLESHS